MALLVPTAPLQLALAAMVDGSARNVLGISPSSVRLCNWSK